MNVEQLLKSHKFLFICGLHRSGTSILHRCIREHPEISGFKNTGVPEDEGQHLQSVYKAAWEYGGPGIFAFNKNSHLTEDSNLISNKNREKILTEWGKYWDYNKQVLVEKSPINLVQTRFLQKLLENSYFLVILRHPVSVTLATKNQLKKKSIKYLFDHWIQAYNIFLNDKNYLNNVKIIYYENFIRFPDNILKEIYEWVGLNYFDNNIEVIDANKKYFKQWNKINIFYRKYLINKYEDIFQKYGYSLINLNYIKEKL